MCQDFKIENAIANDLQVKKILNSVIVPPSAKKTLSLSQIRKVSQLSEALNKPQAPHNRKTNFYKLVWLVERFRNALAIVPLRFSFFR